METTPKESMNISSNHGIGPELISGRESHTTDMSRFEQRLQSVQSYDRKTGAPFNTDFWNAVRGILAPCETSTGYQSNTDATVAIPKQPTDIQGLGQRVGQLGAVNPIHPCRLAAITGCSEDVVINELLVATKVGLTRMRWAPECVRCGSAVLVTDTLGTLPSDADCWGCGKKNSLHSLDKIMVTFTFAPDVLYVLANNYACKPSQKSMGFNAAFAPMAATNSGSGFRYSMGTGAGELRGPLAPGRYRMHCPVSMTDNFLVVERNATEEDEALEVPYHISKMVVTSGEQERNTLHIEHGRVHFDIYPDTNSFFVLWIQEDLDEDTLLHLPQEERADYTSATTVMHHPTFSLFQDQLVPGGSSVLDIANVYLVFTDIVGSTDLYAHQGDGQALQVVHTYFQALFSAFAHRGRIVKTIGDAVMAAFPTAEIAVQAAADGLKKVQEQCVNPHTNAPLQIRLGVHTGSALAVPVNGVNDYFGQTVNIAARVESAAEPSQCLFSESVLEDIDAQKAFDALAQSEDFQKSESRSFKPKGVHQEIVVHGLTCSV